MEATDKSGKVKFTFEMELNQPIMEPLDRHRYDYGFGCSRRGHLEKEHGRKKESHGIGMMMHGYE